MDTDELDWNRSLREQWEWHWNYQVRSRLVGLADDEYFWSPVPDAWSVRPRGTSTAPLHVGAGNFTIDYAFPQPVPPPFATIAWRLGHVIVGVLARSLPAHQSREGGSLPLRRAHKRPASSDRRGGSWVGLSQARVTLPALRQDVHTFSREREPPFTLVRTVWMFGFQRRWVRRCECDTDMPKPGPLPQTSQTAATSILLR